MGIKLTKTEKYFLISLIMFWALFFYLKFFEIPEVLKLRTVINNYRMSCMFEKSMNESIKAASDIKKSIEQSEQSLHGIPEGFKTSEVAAYLYQYTKSAGLNPGKLAISSIEDCFLNNNVDCSNTPSTFKSFNIIYDVQGQYDKLAALIKDIECCERRIDISGVSIVKASQDDVYILSLNLKSYCFINTAGMDETA